jgi:hypothetical protein
MAIEVIQVDASGKKMGVKAHERDGYPGAIVYTREFASRVSTTRAFLNETYGNALNQAATFSGTPVLIHNGGDTAAWTAANVAGSWDFADTTDPYSGSNCVSLTSGNNNDEATFSGSSVDGSNYVAITMQLWLDSFSSASQTIDLQFALSGVNVGVSVDIIDYINPSTLGEYQGVVIPLSDLGIENESFDEAIITVSRSGGARPTFRLDVFQIEELGGGITFEVSPDARTIFYVDEIKFTFADNVTGGAASSYDKILGATLANGFIITRITKNGPVVGRNISSVVDFESFGFEVSAPRDDGTNSMITAQVKFSRPLTLNSLYNERIEISINDDLSGLLYATAIARGESESINGDADLI